MGLDLEQNSGFLVCLGFMSENGDVTVGMETMNDAGARSDASAQTFIADGNATVGADF